MKEYCHVVLLAMILADYAQSEEAEALAPKQRKLKRLQRVRDPQKGITAPV